jgi:antitoxin ParD1/3/4
MNISLPDALKAFVDEQVESAGFGTSSEYIRDLIRREQDRQSLRALLLAGARSARGDVADDAYFASLRTGVQRRRSKKRA